MNDLTYSFLFRTKKYGKWQKDCLKLSSSSDVLEQIKMYVKNTYCYNNDNVRIEVRDIEKI